MIPSKWFVHSARLLALTLVGLLLAAGAAEAGAMTPTERAAWDNARSDRADPQGPPDRVNVLVELQAGADRGPVRAFTTNSGGFVRYEYKHVLPNTISLRNVPMTALEGLERAPGVARIVPDQFHERVINLDESTPLIRGLQSQVGGAGLNADGTGVRICVVDTGIDTDHIMYSDRIDLAASYDFNNNDPNPEDDNGHGSHVAGIALGGTGLSVDLGCEGSEPFQGVAPNATLIGIKVLNSSGGGSDSNIIAGIDHCADPGLPGGRGDVMNLSIGLGQYSGTCDSHSWAQAANNAAAAGVVVVAASGNNGYSNSMSSPACGSNVIAVGATYKDDYPNCEDSQSSFNWCLNSFCTSTCTDNSPNADDLVCFSNRSDNLDVAAPGSVILSASTSAGGSSITGMSGTSQASPHVAGLAALILDLDGGLSPAEVRQVIRDGAIDLGAAGFDTSYGYGRVDVINSLSLVTPCSTNGDCDDGLFCNGAETCSGGSCQAGSDPCPGQDCDETNDVCVPLVCNGNGTCDAGEDCNNCALDCPSGSGAACGNGICELGEDCTNCSDCRGKTGGRPSTRYCCSGTPGGGGGENPVDCNDPRCSQDTWQCSSTADSFCCGDGTCEAGEDEANCAIDCAVSCIVLGDCDDGIGCTDDTCTAGSCSNTANDANCPDDGQFCNGAEFCDPAMDCDSTGDPCSSGETCNEANDSCDPVTCGLRGDVCNDNVDCCSGDCHRNGKCR